MKRFEVKVRYTFDGHYVVRAASEADAARMFFINAGDARQWHSYDLQQRRVPQLGVSHASRHADYCNQVNLLRPRVSSRSR